MKEDLGVTAAAVPLPSTAEAPDAAKRKSIAIKRATLIEASLDEDLTFRRRVAQAKRRGGRVRPIVGLGVDPDFDEGL